MSLPYRYELTLRVTVAGNGLHADGDGAMATAARLRELVRADDHVVEVTPLPADVHYLGKVESFPAPLPATEPTPGPVAHPRDGDERREPWGSGLPGSALEFMTLRYSAEASEWLVVGECRVDENDGNAAVRYDQRTDRPASGQVPVCDVLGGHVGYVDWDEWQSWPLVVDDGENELHS